jgi:hypothetical protein
VRRVLGTAVALLALLTVGGTTAYAAPPAAPAAAAPTVEINSQNPVTAEPPVSRPHTASCTRTLADAFPSNAANGSPQNFSGTLAPPVDCPGPWAKVVLDWTTSVQGRQYDRSGFLDLGRTQIYFGTTYEPDPAGITYHFAKDITEYSALLHTAQPFTGGIGNYTSSVYTGVYTQTVTVTYYQADRANPAPAEPNAVVGLGSQDASAGTPTVQLTADALPRNIVRAYLEVYIKGNGCDEQWFTDVPADVAARFPAAGMCAGGPYREVAASIDGTAAGVTQYFPYIYTGGIVPTLWRPIPAVGTFDMSPELLDVTPFVGRLVDGGNHDVALSVANIDDVWNLSANLLLYTDSRAAATSGALVADSIAPSARQQTTERSGSDGTVTATVTADRDWAITGYVNTSAGRITTTVTQHAAFRNTDTVRDNGFGQHVVETDAGWNRSVSVGGPGGPTVHTHDWSYPITVDASYQITDDNNFTLNGSVDMTRVLSDTVTSPRGLSVVDRSTDEVSSTANDQRANGVTVAADGTEWQHYVGTDDRGDWYDHYLAAAHGYVTADRLTVLAR